MAFFDEERFLAEAIDSVLAQAWSKLELILVDDGSTDSSRIIADSYAGADPRVRVVDHPGRCNRGLSASRNLGIKSAHAPRLAFIDGDDRWPPEKLAQQMAIMDQHPEIGLLAGAARYWNSWSGGLDEIRQVGRIRDCVIEPPEALLTTYPLGDAEAPGTTGFLVTAEAIARVGGFEESFPGMFEDQAFLVKIYLTERIYFSSECWFDYRQHENSMLADNLRRGGYLDARARFLAWLGEYLTEHTVDGRVSSRFRHEQADLRRSLRRRAARRLWQRILVPLRTMRLRLRFDKVKLDQSAP